MSDLQYQISGAKGKRASRQQMVTYLNVATYSAPAWKPLGRTTADSSIERDFGVETKTGIYGEVFTDAKAPTKNQNFSGNDLLAGDEVLNHLINIAVADEDISEVVSQDVLIAHLYLIDGDGNAFAERYPASAVVMTTTGGEGGGMLAADIDVTYGGKREIGTVKKTNDGIEFENGAEKLAAPTIRLEEG